ncbi:MAG: regulator of sigma protease [Solirubrobacteraceae bacterium]|nr:regulator of sigma protease [Solirubrobacteraceae bacterium]
MSYLIAAVGFMLLIVLHELGHFAVAKAVGMRVEKFSLFFGKFLWSFKRGETEYGVGFIPLGGYVKISGMNPLEELPPEVEHRAYFRQKPWKRIVVILAGPAVNIVLAFLILLVVFQHLGVATNHAQVDTVTAGKPADGLLQKGDRIVAVDGKPATLSTLGEEVVKHRCTGTQTPNCRAETPVVINLLRDGEPSIVHVRPRYDADPKVKTMRIGISSIPVARGATLGESADNALDQMWFVTRRTAHVISHIFSAKQRKQLSGVVGSYEATRNAVDTSTTDALFILALISLSLGVVNLFPFLPLDGGHVFWAVAEKVRGRAIPFSVMERAGFVGFFLVIGFAVIGLSNDIDRLLGPGFGTPR